MLKKRSLMRGSVVVRVDELVDDRGDRRQATEAVVERLLLLGHRRRLLADGVLRLGSRRGGVRRRIGRRRGHRGGLLRTTPHDESTCKQTVNLHEFPLARPRRMMVPATKMTSSKPPIPRRGRPFIYIRWHHARDRGGQSQRCPLRALLCTGRATGSPSGCEPGTSAIGAPSPSSRASSAWLLSLQSRPGGGPEPRSEPGRRPRCRWPA